MSPESQNTQPLPQFSADELVAAIERLAITLGMALVESTSCKRADRDQPARV